ncbi:hypothetical protein VTO73DRAFT_1384 [Trametes versicolor]
MTNADCYSFARYNLADLDKGSGEQTPRRAPSASPQTVGLENPEKHNWLTIPLVALYLCTLERSRATRLQWLDPTASG